ncbi:hypothetical protein MKW92_009258, partial [Papaver armeniacum]
GEGPDWQDFVGIVCLLIINSTISFIAENNAGNAAAALMARLAPKSKVLRDGRWQELDASVLVPGDIISIKLGDIIPADARLLEGDSLKIDQSALTGESLPVTKKAGDEVYSGSTCKQGEIEAVVIATGRYSFLGKAAIWLTSLMLLGISSRHAYVLTAIGNFCICWIAVGMILEIIVMFPIQHRPYRTGINNLLVLLIGGIPIGAITKRMTAIEEMAGMDVLCSDKIGTLTLNRLNVDRSLIEVFNKNMDKDTVVLLAARASRLENQDAIDTAIINMLADPKEARENITPVHFLPFNPVEKRTAITYIDSEGNWHRASKGAPEQILNLCEEKEQIAGKVHAIIDKIAERGLRSLGVACQVDLKQLCSSILSGRFHFYEARICQFTDNYNLQEVPEKSESSPGGPWTLCGLLPLFDPPRHDSAETIRRALHLGVCVKMITGDQLAIAKETGRRLGMGTNIYPSSALLDRNRDDHEALPVDELVEQADGFAGVFPEHKYEIVKMLQEKKHICGMTGDGVNDAPALKKADIGIAVSDSTDAARSAADIVLTEPGLSVIIHAVLTSRSIFQRMKNYTIYAVSITIRIVLGFVLLTLIWKYDFPPFMVLVIAILNDGTIMTISKDRVKPSPKPDNWKLNEIFATGIVIGTYLALVTVLFYWIVTTTTFFQTHFHLKTLSLTNGEVSSAVYLHVSVISQALIFVTRSQSWSFVERPGILLMCAFVVAQLVATVIAVHANVSFASIHGIGWGWAGAIWLYSLVFYVPLDIIKFAVCYALSGAAWNLVFDRKTAFTSKKDYGKEDREAKWVLFRRLLEGINSTDLDTTGWRSSMLAEKARRRAEIARMGELHTISARTESALRLTNLDMSILQTAHTL